MEDFKIDNDVPVPAGHKRFNTRVPYQQLDVGESILFPLEQRHGVAANSATHAKRYDKKFTVRKVSDTEARIWRVK